MNEQKKLDPAELQDKRLGAEIGKPETTETPQKRKYLKFSGNLNRTPFGWKLQIFMSDKLMDVILKRNQERFGEGSTPSS